MRQQIVDAFLDDGALRIEKFVDRRADGDDDGAGLDIPAGALVKISRLSRERLDQQRLGAMLDERQLPGLQGGESLLVEIVDVDGQPLGGERSTSGIPTWPAPPTTVKSAVSAVAARAAGRSAIFNASLQSQRP